MLYIDNTTNLLNLQDFEVEKIEETEKEGSIINVGETKSQTEK